MSELGQVTANIFGVWRQSDTDRDLEDQPDSEAGCEDEGTDGTDADGLAEEGGVGIGQRHGHRAPDAGEEVDEVQLSALADRDEA